MNTAQQELLAKFRIPNTDPAPKPCTKAGVVCALNALGFRADNGPFPAALKNIPSAASHTRDEYILALYLRDDDDFGGAWNDADQIESLAS